VEGQQIRGVGTDVAEMTKLTWSSSMSTVLLVDDEPDNLWVYQLALEGNGHHALLADSGESGLSVALRELPDLIVTDWNMPGMDGVELCTRLKLFPALARVPVIMISARTPPDSKSGLWNTFLRKPVDLNAFESSIALLLARRLLSPAIRECGLERAPSRLQPVFPKYWA
jgi:CheY-like chemotaxis protein